MRSSGQQITRLVDQANHLSLFAGKNQPGKTPLNPTRFWITPPLCCVRPAKHQIPKPPIRSLNLWHEILSHPTPQPAVHQTKSANRHGLLNPSAYKAMAAAKAPATPIKPRGKVLYPG